MNYIVVILVIYVNNVVEIIYINQVIIHVNQLIIIIKH